MNKAPGSVNVASGGGAYTLVLVVAHEPAGQRDLSTPGVRERITETLRARKEQLLRTAYLTTARNDVAWSTTWRAAWSSPKAPCRAFSSRHQARTNRYGRHPPPTRKGLGPLFVVPALRIRCVALIGVQVSRGPQIGGNKSP